MKFIFATRDIIMVHVDQKVARECDATSLRAEPTNRERSREPMAPRKDYTITLIDLVPRMNNAPLELGEDLHLVRLQDNGGRQRSGAATVRACVQ